MERKIGETFEYEGKKIEVRAAIHGCDGCFYKGKCRINSAVSLGSCAAGDRTDKKHVVFVEVEQPQETEEGRERRIGEVFEYEGKKLKVVEGENECDKCYFYNKIYCTRIDRIAGACLMSRRIDNKSVRFVEVTEEHETQQAEQPQKTEEIKERKVGEVFEYEGHKLKVVADTDGRKCPKCFFYSRDCSLIRDVTGYCLKEKRIDRKGVTFVEVKNEQPHEQAEQPQKLNLCEILKNCPEGTELWSDNYGIVKFVNVVTEWDTPIRVKLTNGSIARYTEEGWCDKRFPANCLLWPSRDCRDWTKFTAPWYKKEKFDPKTLKPFDRVLVKNEDYNDFTWGAALFSHLITIHDDINIDYLEAVTTRCTSSFCIPYNDDTKHLVGTKDEAPDLYKYWED